MGESLKSDLGAIIEGFQVLWGKVAALWFPPVVVDATSLQKGAGGMFGEGLSAADLVDLGSGDIEDPGVLSHLHVARFDAIHALVLECLNESVELVSGCAQCHGSCTHGNLGALVQQLLLLLIVPIK